MAFRNDLLLRSQIEKFIAEGGLSPISTDMKESIVKYFPDIEKYEFQMEDIKAFYINCLKQELKEKAVQEQKTEGRRKICSLIHILQPLLLEYSLHLEDLFQYPSTSLFQKKNGHTLVIAFYFSW